MARIRSIQTRGDVTAAHPTEVDAEVRRVTLPGGNVLLQLSTFGSDQRASEPKVSQTIQFDRAAAARLKDLIEETFEL